MAGGETANKPETIINTMLKRTMIRGLTLILDDGSSKNIKSPTAEAGIGASLLLDIDQF